MTIKVQQIASELCEVLGLDANKVTAISFDWRPGDVAKITVQFLVDSSEDMVKVFKQYELVEKE